MKLFGKEMAIGLKDWAQRDLAFACADKKQKEEGYSSGSVPFLKYLNLERLFLQLPTNFECIQADPN